MYIQRLDFIKYKRTVFNQKTIAEDAEIKKCTCEIFCLDY